MNQFCELSTWVIPVPVLLRPFGNSAASGIKREKGWEKMKHETIVLEMKQTKAELYFTSN
jgi:hypothetical protein